MRDDRVSSMSSESDKKPFALLWAATQLRNSCRNRLRGTLSHVVFPCWPRTSYDGTFNEQTIEDLEAFRELSGRTWNGHVGSIPMRFPQMPSVARRRSSRSLPLERLYQPTNIRFHFDLIHRQCPDLVRHIPYRRQPVSLHVATNCRRPRAHRLLPQRTACYDAIS